MGLRGPKPKSAELESAQGFPGRRKRESKARAKPQSQQQQTAADSASVPASSPSPADASPPTSHRIPPAPAWLRKPAKAIWAETWSAPDALIRLKSTDGGTLARYCHLRAEYEAIAKRMPALTVRVLKHAPKDKDSLPEYVDRRNPLWEQMMVLSKELRPLEQLLGLTPVSRIALAGKLAGHDEPPVDRDGDRGSSAGRSSSKPNGPLGVLKAQRHVN